MPWVWVAVGLVLLTVAVAVIALCMAVRQIDARLGRDRQWARGAMEPEPRPGAEVEVE